jgi:hypothetical protein
MSSRFVLKEKGIFEASFDNLRVRQPSVSLNAEKCRRAHLADFARHSGMMSLG